MTLAERCDEIVHMIDTGLADAQIPAQAPLRPTAPAPLALCAGSLAPGEIVSDDGRIKTERCAVCGFVFWRYPITLQHDPRMTPHRRAS